MITQKNNLSPHQELKTPDLENNSDLNMNDIHQVMKIDAKKYPMPKSFSELMENLTESEEPRVSTTDKTVGSVLTEFHGFLKNKNGGVGELRSYRGWLIKNNEISPLVMVDARLQLMGNYKDLETEDIWPSVEDLKSDFESLPEFKK